MSARTSDVGPGRPTTPFSPRNAKSSDRPPRTRPTVPPAAVRVNALFGCSLAVSTCWPAKLQSTFPRRPAEAASYCRQPRSPVSTPTAARRARGSSTVFVRRWTPPDSSPCRVDVMPRTASKRAHSKCVEASSSAPNPGNGSPSVSRKPSPAGAPRTRTAVGWPTPPARFRATPGTRRRKVAKEGSRASKASRFSAVAASPGPEPSRRSPPRSRIWTSVALRRVKSRRIVMSATTVTGNEGSTTCAGSSMVGA